MIILSEKFHFTSYTWYTFSYLYVLRTYEVLLLIHTFLKTSSHLREIYYLFFTYFLSKH